MLPILDPEMDPLVIGNHGPWLRWCIPPGRLDVAERIVSRLRAHGVRHRDEVVPFDVDLALPRLGSLPGLAAMAPLAS